MKIKLLIILLLLHPILKAQKDQDNKAEIAKTGWNVGFLPAISFDTDLGFQYGGLVNLFDYGNGSRFPVYNHSLYFEISRFTKGSGIYRFNYDSDQLIKGVRISTDITYMPEKAYDFYGFNGYESVLNKTWEDDEHADYRTRMFYKMEQNLFRFKADVQGPIGQSNFKWLVGFNLLNFNIGSVDVDRLNRGKSDDDKLPAVADEPGLYEKYLEWELIGKEEANGGFIPELKGGLVFDSRDNRPNPMKGLWTEAVIAVIPEFLGAESSFSKLAITHRQYFTIVDEDLSFAYRLGWQQTLWGEVPFYYQSQIITSIMAGATSTGLGGARSLRGIRRNRVVGEGMVFGNAEFRWKAIHAQLIKQNFYFGLNSFFDFGCITKKIDTQNQISIISEPDSEYFNFGTEKFHASYGLGLRVVMNRNFIVGCDYGRAIKEQDGDSGLYIGLNYLF
jgi:hypothetical protein